MHVYIIAKYIDDNNKDSGYMLVDIDDNNKTMSVNKQQLINVLKAKKMKLYNAKLVNNHIAGTYYSLDILPKILPNGNVSTKYPFVCLNNKYDREFTMSLVRCGSVQIGIIDKDTLYRYIQCNNVANIDTNGVLCEKLDAESYLKNNKRNFDKEVTDENTPWNIDDFEAYMHIHGYKYQLVKLDPNINDSYQLCGIDINCTKIKIPLGVKYITYLYEKEIYYIESLIIPKGVCSIGSLYLGRMSSESNLITIKDLIFQKFDLGNHILFDSSAFDYVYITNKLVLPKHSRLHNMLNNSKVNSLPVIEYNDINNCFNGLRLNKPIIEINTKEILRSFSNINCSTIKLGSNVQSITCESLKELACTSLIISENSSLTKIEKSLYDMPNLMSLDLSKCAKLAYISGSIHNIPKLKDIKLPDNLRSLSNDFLNKVNVDELKLPDSLMYLDIITSVENIIYPETIDSISRSLISGNVLGKNVQFKAPIKNIHSCSFENVTYILNFNKIQANFDNTVLHKEAFKSSYIEEFDSRLFKNNSIIPKECFMGSLYMKTVILGDNIDRIEEYAFKNCVRLQKIAISDKVEYIDKTAFMYMNTIGYCSIFVVKDSYAHKFFSKSKHKYNIIVVDSFDEAVANIIDDSVTSETKQDKFTMILNNTDYEILLDKKYINYVSVSYKIIRDLEENKDKPSNNILDTSKFIYKNINDVSKLDINKLSLIRSQESSKENEDKFIGICNLITKMSDNCEYLYSDNILNGNCLVKDINIMYADSRNMILKVILSNDDVILSVSKRRMTFLMIIISNNIVFMTPYFKTLFDFTGFKLAFDETRCSTDNTSIGSYLKTTDTYYSMGDVKIGGALIPNKWLLLIGNNMRNNFIFIGTARTKLPTSVNDKSNDKKQFILLYDSISMQFIELEAKIGVDNIQGYARYSGINSFYVKQLYKLDDIDKIKDIYTKEFKEQFNPKYMLNLIKATALKGYKGIEKKYTPIINNTLVDFCKNMYKYNIRSIDNLTLPIAKMLLTLDMFKDTKTCMNELIKKNINPTLNTINNSDYFIVEYKINYDDYIIGIISENTNMKDTSVLKHCNISLNNLISYLYSIGEFTINKDIKPLPINNDKIDTDNYIFTDCFTNTGESGFRINVAIEKATGYACLISEYYDMDFYNLFKFKKIHDAYDVLNLIKEDEDCVLTNFISLATRIKENSITSNTTLFNLRLELLNGLPEGIPSAYDSYNIVDKLVKQEKM